MIHTCVNRVARVSAESVAGRRGFGLDSTALGVTPIQWFWTFLFRAWQRHRKLLKVLSSPLARFNEIHLWFEGGHSIFNQGLRWTLKPESCFDKHLDAFDWVIGCRLGLFQGCKCRRAMWPVHRHPSQEAGCQAAGALSLSWSVGKYSKAHMERKDAKYPTNHSYVDFTLIYWIKH